MDSASGGPVFPVGDLPGAQLECASPGINNSTMISQEVEMKDDHESFASGEGRATLPSTEEETAGVEHMFFKGDQGTVCAVC